MKKAYCFVVLTALLFSTMEVACKVAGNDLDPFQLTFLRFLIGGLILLPFGIAEMKKKEIKLNHKDLLKLLGVGTIGIPISMVLFQIGIMNCNASSASVMFSIINGNQNCSYHEGKHNNDWATNMRISCIFLKVGCNIING